MKKYKKAEDLVAGDVVVGEDGSKRVVSDVCRGGKIFNDGRWVKIEYERNTDWSFVHRQDEVLIGCP